MSHQYQKITHELETLVCEFYGNFNQQIDLLKSLTLSANNGGEIKKRAERLVDIANSLPSQLNGKLHNVSSTSLNVKSQIKDSDIPYMSVPYGSAVRFTLAYVCSSRNFYLHLDYDEVESFWQSLNDVYAGLELADIKLNSIKVNNFYCADVNGEFQRVKVVADRLDGSYDLFLVDFGEMKFAIEKKVIYQLVPQFASQPIFALNCFIDEQWLDDLSTFETAFLDMVAEPQNYCIGMRAIFSKPLENRKFPVKLEFNMKDRSFKSVATFSKCFTKHSCFFKRFDFKYFRTDSEKRFNGQAITVEAFKMLSSSYPSSYLDYNTEYKSHFSSVIDLSNFICIVDSFNGKDGEFINFCTNLNYFYIDWPQEKNFDKSVNSFVVFRLNKHYFRGFIYSTDFRQYDILAIDCGFSATILPNDLYPLADSVSIEKYPPFAFLCEVDDLIPLNGGTWSSFAIRVMKNFLRNDFTISPRSFTDKYSVTVTVATPTHDIGAVLKKLNFAQSKR